jgi:hypothetical protein
MSNPFDMSGGTFSNGFAGPAPTLDDILATAEAMKSIRLPPRAWVISKDMADALRDAAPPSGVRMRFDVSGVRVRVSDLLPPGTCVEDPTP